MSMFGKNASAFGEAALMDQVDESYDANSQEDQEQLDAEAAAFEEAQSTLSQVEERIAKTQYYGLVLKTKLFGENHPMAREVEAEIRAFVIEKLEIYTGMRAEADKVATASPFDDEQTQALSLWANKLLKRPLLAGVEHKAAPQAAAPRKTASPTLNTIETRVLTKTEPAQAKTAIRKPGPQQRAPFKKKEAKFMEVDSEILGKKVKVSLDEQTKPEGIKPKEFPNAANGIENGAASGSVNAGGDRMGGNFRSQLVNHFMR